MTPLPERTEKKSVPYRFENRSLCIATMHEKERVLALVLQAALGVKIVPCSLNTDELGTFSGEIERKQSVVETARLKCIQGMASCGASLAVSSEGSFGPHPALPFVYADHEVLFFYDAQDKIEVVVQDLSTDTNFGATDIRTLHELETFMKRSKFPEHALIIRKHKQDTSYLFKGIHNAEVLVAHANHLLATNGSCWVETDMRAMHNPSRMQFIEQLAHKLIQKITNTCPRCHWPGFGVSKTIAGLPCGWCGRATRSTAFHVYVCSACQLTLQQPANPHKTTEDPMYCDFCNP